MLHECYSMSYASSAMYFYNTYQKIIQRLCSIVLRHMYSISLRNLLSKIFSKRWPLKYSQLKGDAIICPRFELKKTPYKSKFLVQARCRSKNVYDNTAVNWYFVEHNTLCFII